MKAGNPWGGASNSLQPAGQVVAAHVLQVGHDAAMLFVDVVNGRLHRVARGRDDVVRGQVHCKQGAAKNNSYQL